MGRPMALDGRHYLGRHKSAHNISYKATQTLVDRCSTLVILLPHGPFNKGSYHPHQSHWRQNFDATANANENLGLGCSLEICHHYWSVKSWHIVTYLNVSLKHCARVLSLCFLTTSRAMERCDSWAGGATHAGASCAFHHACPAPCGSVEVDGICPALFHLGTSYCQESRRVHLKNVCARRR